MMTRWTYFSDDGSQVGAPSHRELFLEEATSSQAALVAALRGVRRMLEDGDLAALVEFPADPAHRPCLLVAQSEVTRRVRVQLALPGLPFGRVFVEVDARPREGSADLREAVLDLLLDVKYERGGAAQGDRDPAAQIAARLRARFPGRAWWAQLHQSPAVTPGPGVGPGDVVVVLRCRGAEARRGR